MPNLLQYPVAIWYFSAGMIVVVPLTRFTRRASRHQLNDSGAAAIIIVSNFAHTRWKEVVEKTSVQHVILTRMSDQLYRQRRGCCFVVKYIKRLGAKIPLARCDLVLTRYSMATGHAVCQTRGCR